MSIAMAETDQASAEFAERLADVRARIAAAAEQAGRSRHAVTLVAVSKTFDAAAVRAAAEAGQVDFGENRAQELTDKAQQVGAGVRWHFVGRLQRNKVADVVAVAGLIHSVDRIELAETIASRARRAGRVQQVLVQVNVGDDPAKGGVAVPDTAPLVARIARLDGIVCVGLMTMPPMSEDPRPLFARLCRLRDGIRADHAGVAHLSMGMSADYELAIGEGATIVRVGEALFGRRFSPQRAATQPE